MTAEFGENNSVAVYTVDEDGFVRSTISNDLNAPLAVEIADFDGDGDQDVAAGAYYGNSVVWYANEDRGTSIHPPKKSPTTLAARSDYAQPIGITMQTSI